MRDIRGEKGRKAAAVLPEAHESASVAALADRVKRLKQDLEKERRLMAEAFPRSRS